jgi:hypothetical protein
MQDRLNDEVRAYLADVGPCPRYGSSQWAHLARDDPRRHAAVYRAAECWRDHCSTDRVTADMLAAVRTDEVVMRRRFKLASMDILRGLGAWRPGVPYDELAQRRDTYYRQETAS